MSFQTLPQSSSAVVGWRVEGRLTASDAEAMHEQLDLIIADHGSARVLIDLTPMEGLEPSAFWEDLRRSVGKLDEVERIAVVGDESWHRWMSSVSDRVSPADASHYAPAEVDAAWVWLRS